MIINYDRSRVTVSEISLIPAPVLDYAGMTTLT